MESKWLDQIVCYSDLQEAQHIRSSPTDRANLHSIGFEGRGGAAGGGRGHGGGGEGGRERGGTMQERVLCSAPGCFSQSTKQGLKGRG